MNLRIVFKFRDCNLQFYKKRRLFSYFSVNPRTPASRWRRLLKLKRKKKKLLLSGKPVKENWSIPSETFNCQKQELQTKLYRGAVQYGKSFVFMTRTVHIAVITRT